MNSRSLTYYYKTADIIMKLIAINVVIYLLVTLTSFLLRIAPYTLTQWFVLPEELGEFILQPWALLTYAFLHFGFWHILWNMLVLYWFGRFVTNLFDEKRFLTIYLLGAISGGLLYMLAYNIFPVFDTSRGYLLGASAAVRAIMIFIAAYTPQTSVRLIFFNVKLWQIGIAVVLLDLIQIPTSGNAGGLIAHLGGALFGYVYALQLSKGNDIGTWFTNWITWAEHLLKPRTKKPFTKVHRNTKGYRKTTKTADPTDHQQKVDAILDKISKSGYESLTKAEKDYLFKAGKE
ncbi:MAG: rhomboid family intramembrane serine protease [Flavobacteriaceae bacterium]|nr:rhomboid family intramembrane serine protease [Flavobacteriaceae bacterium]